MSILENAKAHVANLNEPPRFVRRRYRGAEDFAKEIGGAVDPLVHADFLAQQAQLINLIQTTVSASAEEEGFETEEEANDFEWDEPDDLVSPHIIRELEPDVTLEAAAEIQELAAATGKANVEPVQNAPAKEAP